MGGDRRGANYAAAHTGGTLTITYYDVMEFLLQICFRSLNLLARARAVKQDRNFQARVDRAARAIASHASPSNVSPIAFRPVAKKC